MRRFLAALLLCTCAAAQPPEFGKLNLWGLQNKLHRSAEAMPEGELKDEVQTAATHDRLKEGLQQERVSEGRVRDKDGTPQAGGTSRRGPRTPGWAAPPERDEITRLSDTIFKEMFDKAIADGCSEEDARNIAEDAAAFTAFHEMVQVDQQDPTPPPQTKEEKEQLAREKECEAICAELELICHIVGPPPVPGFESGTKRGDAAVEWKEGAEDLKAKVCK